MSSACAACLQASCCAHAHLGKHFSVSVWRADCCSRNIACNHLLSHIAVQACAKQCLGRQPVVFPDCYKAPAVRDTWRHLFEPGFNFLWKPEWAKEQWWIDAFTIDPSQLLHDMRGLWEHGIPQPVMATAMENASIGTLPKILVYIACHQEFGTHMWFPYHGAKHGSGDKDGVDGMYEGFEYWFDSDDGEFQARLARLIGMQYYNRADALQKFERRASASEKAAFRSNEFDPWYFMVRLYFTTAPKSCQLPASSLLTCARLQRHARAPAPIL